MARMLLIVGGVSGVVALLMFSDGARAKALPYKPPGRPAAGSGMVSMTHLRSAPVPVTGVGLPRSSTVTGRFPMERSASRSEPKMGCCLLYTSDAADEEDSVDLGGRRIINK